MTARPLATVILGIVLCSGGAGPNERTIMDGAFATGRIGGRVRDTIGQVLPGVTITVMPNRGGRARQTITDRDGVYRLEGLPDDTYRIDFLLAGFDLVRENHVRAGADPQVDVDATLAVSAVCECVNSGLSTTAEPIAGQVVDNQNRPLPHARLDVVSPARRETAYTDSDGRFYVRLPLDGAWPITASDTGFASVTEQISKASSGPLVLKLRFEDSGSLPRRERFRLGCLCPEYFGRRE